MSLVAFCLQSLIIAHQEFKKTLGEADKEFQSIVDLEKEVLQISQKFGMTTIVENPYTTLNANVRL